MARFGGEWILCASTYPQPNGELYGNATARLFLFRSADLEHWSTPERIRVKGPDVPGIGKYVMVFHGTGPEPVKFLTHGCIGIAWSDDLKTWSWPGKQDSGTRPP